MKEIATAIGAKLKTAREEKGLTQKELGDFLNYSPMGISHFENGLREMKISDIHKAAEFFGKEPSYFLTPGLTLFRANTVDRSEGVTESVAAFDQFLATRNKK